MNVAFVIDPGNFAAIFSKITISLDLIIWLNYSGKSNKIKLIVCKHTIFSASDWSQIVIIL